MPKASTLNRKSAKTRKGHNMRRRLVVPAWDDLQSTSYALGGKGHGITRLMALGLPTPPALVVSTSLCRSYQETGTLPKRFNEQLARELEALERKTGKRFGDPLNPLLVSVRSGAMISMPGMMETVLNVGLTPAVSDALEEKFGEQFITDCHRHLISALGGTRYDRHDERGSALRQLREAIMKVLWSWNSPRAKAYRREHNIDERLGTAVTIQAMVFGNRVGSGESGTGVAMSHHPDTAEPGLFGNYLPSAQGHDLVSGAVTPESISTLTDRCPEYATILTEALGVLETEVGGPVEVEFTVEDGTLYFLQFRAAKLSPEATIINLVRRKESGNMTRDEVVEAVPEWVAEAVSEGDMLYPDYLVECKTTAAAMCLAQGDGIGRFAAYGATATTEEEAIHYQKTGEPYILVRETTTPDDFELMLGAVGIITKEGGSTCHAAMVARHQGIPAVIGIGDEDFHELTHPFGWDMFGNGGRTVTLDAASGKVLLGKHPMIKREVGREVSLFHKWRQTGKPVIQPELCQEEFATNTALNDFYLAEAMLKACTDEALAAKIRRVHKQLTTRTSAVFSTYLALAVASEVTYADRSIRSLGLSPELQHQYAMLKAQVTLQHRDKWSGLVAPEIAHELAAATPVQVRVFFTICRRVFAEGSWGGSVGGTAWAEIARVGELFWNGDIAAETFVDRVFDLRHNTDTVLNKHRMVYRRSMSWMLTQQLDIKRRELSVTNKWAALTAVHNDVNQQLIELFAEGQQKGVWQ